VINKIYIIILTKTLEFIEHGGLHFGFVLYNAIAMICILYTISRLGKFLKGGRNEAS